jgi:hypothetical protein
MLASAMLVLVLSRDLWAFDAAFLSFEQLCASADLIVAARCEEVASTADVVNDTPRPKELDRFDIHDEKTVRLVVTTCIKGDANLKSVLVRSGGSLQCPIPQRYEPGANVIAFLDRPQVGERWETIGQRSDSSGDSAAVYPRIKELATLQQANSDYRNDPRYATWLLDCLEDPATERFAFEDGDRPQPKLLKPIVRPPKEQKQRILALVLQHPERRYLLQLLPLVADVADPRIKKLVKDGLTEAKKSPHCENAAALMAAMCVIDPSDRRTRILEAYQNLDTAGGDDYGDRRTLLYEFLQSLEPTKMRFP